MSVEMIWCWWFNNNYFLQMPAFFPSWVGENYWIYHELLKTIIVLLHSTILWLIPHGFFTSKENQMSQDFHSSKSVNLYFSLTLRTYVLLVVLVSDLLASLWSKLKRHSDMTNLQFTIIIKKTLPLSMKLIF